MSAQQQTQNWSHLRTLDAFGDSGGHLRIVVLVVFAIAAFLLPDLPGGTTIGSILLVEAMLMPLLESRTDPTRRDLMRVSLDHVTALVITFFVPDVWAACALIILGNSIWWSLRTQTRATQTLVVLSPAAVAILGALLRPQGWLTASIVVLTLTALFYALSHRLRTDIETGEADLAQALSTSGSVVHVTDVSTGVTESVIGPIEDILGWTAEEWMNLDHSELLHPDDHADFRVEEHQCEENSVVDRRGRFRRPDGSYAWIRDVSRVVRAKSGELKLRGFTLDVTEIEHAQQVIRRQAETDELTGLANRSVLLADMERRFGEGQTFGLAFLDLDRFKNINDTLGHSFGDSVLIEIARRLRTIGRASDAVVRLGGDEFAVVIADLNDDEAATRLARRIATACARVMQLHGVTISTAASIGVALAPRDGTDVHTLLRHADIAMYEAKRERRTFQIFNPDIQQAPLEEVTLSASIGTALRNNEFILQFQPKVDTRTGAVVGFEGLARWDHPEFGLLSPDRFIHLVTLGDYSRVFADRILNLGASFAARCAQSGHHLAVAVNISARSLADDSLADRVSNVLSQHRLSPDQLIVEITEHDIMSDDAANSRVLDRLHGLGVALSIDDFGTGHSSLARLVDLPISEIKVDRRFVSRATTSKQDAVIVRSIIDLALNLGLNVIAEGVETEEESALLTSFGCHQAQGYLYARPLNASDALASLDRRLVPTPPGSSIGSNER